MMKILIHDYAGHPFQIDLSRELAKNGFNVWHLYTSSSGGPKGGLESDTENLKIIDVKSESVAKQNFLKRRAQEKKYGKKCVEVIKGIMPDVVLSSNTPLDAQKSIIEFCEDNGIRFVFWLQDIISIAAESILKKKLGFLGSLAAKYYNVIEKDLLKRSDHVITIADDFNGIIEDWGVKKESITAIPNWAPIEEIPVKNKKNPFSDKYNLEDKFVVLYSGTLGMKHNPEIIYETAKSLNENREIVFVVISEGQGMNYLKNRLREEDVDNLKLLPFQPFDQFPNVLGASDVTLTLLEPEAGIFSVPSKVWSSYSAQRPTLLVVPKENLSAKITERVRAGIVIPPSSVASLKKAVVTLLENSEKREEMGRNARTYAEENFYVKEIAKKFQKILTNF